MSFENSQRNDYRIRKKKKHWFGQSLSSRVLGMWTLGRDESESIPDALAATGALCVKWAPDPPSLEGLVCVEGLVSGAGYGGKGDSLECCLLFCVFNSCQTRNIY